MHELAITEQIVSIVDQAARGRRVTRVTLEIGALAGVMGDAIAFCFEALARGTALDGAALDIVQIGGRARCRLCGDEFAADAFYAPCRCGSHELDWLRGQELGVKSIEIEEAS
jgi:hydrogenase nickel incorporation protein HypA/HybF